MSKKDCAKILEHAIYYAEFQVGGRAPGKAYRERRYDQQITNYKAEIVVLIPLYCRIIYIYAKDNSLSSIQKDNEIFPFVKKSLDILKPWSLCLELDVISRIDSLDEDQTNHILHLLSMFEEKMATICMHRNEFDLSEKYCQLSLSHARRYEGEEGMKTGLLYDALSNYSDLRRSQGKYVDAIPFAEDAYNVVALAYNPVHPDVQTAAGNLIECLVHTDDLQQAEIYAQLTLDSLKDTKNGLCQESEEVARGYHDLENVISEQEGDLVKAELHAREACRIRGSVFSNNDFNCGSSVGLLAQILHKQGKLGDETINLYERALVSHISNEGPGGLNTATVNSNLGTFYHSLSERQLIADRREEHLRLSSIHYKEALRIYTKMYGPANCLAVKVASQLSIVLKLFE